MPSSPPRSAPPWPPGPDPRDGFALDRRDEFLGRVFPNMRNRSRQRAFIRLFHRRHGRWNPDQLIHEEVVVPGRSIPLPGRLLHWRNFTLGEQLGRFLTNAPLEVAQMQAHGRRAGPLPLLAWPLLRFGWCYLACGGWRLGLAGLVQAMLMAHAEFLRWASLWEAQQVVPSPHPPAALLAAKVASRTPGR